MPTKQNLVLSAQRGAVGALTLNAPERKNALNLALLRALNAQLARLDADDSVRVILLSGSGKLFSEGADLAEMSALGDYEAIKRADYLTGDFEYIASVTKPIVAAIHGFTLGGGLELALMCDIIVAADNARLGFPEINSALMPGGGGTQRLVRQVGKYRAMELMLTGRTIRAAEAERMGLVSAVVAAAELAPAAEKLAQQIAQHPLNALLAIKQAVRNGEELPLSEALAAERDLFHKLLGEHNGNLGGQGRGLE